MKTLKVFNYDNTPQETSQEFEIKKSVRGIILDNNKNIALVHSQKLNYHTLPGGGIEPGETPQQAIIRECREETDCTVNIIKALGIVREIREEHKKIGEITGYLLETTRQNTQILRPDEQEELLTVIWTPLKKARETFHDEIIKYPEHKHIGQRALVFIDEILKNSQT
jgi:ADP-ribose pyrophosphatase YjhB (NUDIX family)